MTLHRRRDSPVPGDREPELLHRANDGLVVSDPVNAQLAPAGLGHRAALTKAESANERLLDAYLTGVITKDVFVKRQEKLTREIAAAQHAINTCGVRWHDMVL